MNTTANSTTMDKVLRLVTEPLIWRIPSADDLRRMSYFTMANYVNVIAGVIFICVAIYQVRSGIKAANALPKNRILPAPGFPEIEPLRDFDWESTEPLKFRPFKDKYHLTMALENLDPSELIPMDKQYISRLKYRKQLIKDHPSVVRALDIDPETGLPDPRIRPALSELYTWIMGTYLPGRYPDMFQLKATEYENGKTDLLHNMVTGSLLPTTISQGTEGLYRALETLGTNIDEDFLILLPTRSPSSSPSSTRSSTPEEARSNDPTDPSRTYTLSAYINCYPSGFNPAEKLGLKLADIHTPVPGYAAKLEKSMDRFFRSIPIGKYVARANWSVIVNTPLFAAFGGTHDHNHETEKTPATTKSDDWTVDRDLDKTVLRCERQTLHRLVLHAPIRACGDGEISYCLEEVLGNVPAMEVYKRGLVWEMVLELI